MQSQARAAFWMVLSIISFVIMSVAGRALTSRVDVFQVMEMRAVVGFILLLPLVYAAGGFRAMKTRRPGVHIARNVMHYMGQYAWFVALGLIPLAELISIEFTLPFWVAILAVLFLGEKMTARKVAAILLGLAGVILIVRPGLDTVQPGHLIILAGVGAFSVAVVLVKSLTRTDSVVQIIFWMLIIQFMIGLVPAIMVWENPPVELWPAILIVSATGTFSHYFMARALSYADATLILPLDFLRLPLTAVAGWVFFGEGLDSVAIAGAVLILLGNVLTLRKGKPAVTDAP